MYVFLIISVNKCDAALSGMLHIIGMELHMIGQPLNRSHEVLVRFIVRIYKPELQKCFRNIHIPHECFKQPG